MEQLPIKYNINKIQEQIEQTNDQLYQIQRTKVETHERIEMMNNEKEQWQARKLQLVVEIEDTNQILDQTISQDP